MASQPAPSASSGPDVMARTLGIVEMLCRHPVAGLTNGELARLVGDSPSNVSRCCARLVALGWARKDESGRYLPIPRPLGLLEAYNMAMDTLARRHEDFRRGVAARARQYLSPL